MSSGDDSAFAILGLRPGASRAQVDEAYRRLIKRHHPDRTGGDGGRAAEINRAYTMLRRGDSGPARPRWSVPVPVQPRVRPRRRRRAPWMFAAGLVIVAAVGASADIPRQWAPGRGYPVPVGWAMSADRPADAVLVSPVADFEEPIEAAVIDRSIADALDFHSAGDAAATAEYSRACHTSLRDEPSLTWFDSCTAFDEAMVILSGRPFTGSGPFDASSVMARQMGAARTLSDDMLAADSRLHQIRSRVELALVPKLDEAAAPMP